MINQQVFDQSQITGGWCEVERSHEVCNTGGPAEWTGAAVLQSDGCSACQTSLCG